jgi:hypothetical protein
MELEHNTKPMLDNMNRLGHFYKLVPHSDHDDDLPSSSKSEQATRRADKLRAFSILGAIIALLGLVSLGLRFITKESSSPPQKPILTYCGDTRDQALAKGCTFDMMSWSWMPPACEDVQLSNEYLQLREWEWFADKNMTQPVSRDEVEQGIVKHVWTSREWEEVQCVYNLRKVHRAARAGRPIDGFAGHKEYSEYCADLLVETARAREEGTEFQQTVFETEVKFVHCRRYD